MATTNAQKRATEAYRMRCLEQGRCTRCGKPIEPERVGKWRCLSCMAIEAESRRKHREELRKAGLCFRCGKPIEEERRGKKQCEACASNTRAAINRRRERLREQGLCVDCGIRPVYHGRMRCFECLLKAAETQNKCKKKGTES